MAYNTRSIKKDVDGRPIPQYYNQTTDDYEPLQGENGAARSILWGPNGQPLSVIDNKLAVRAADLETLIGALNDSAVTNPANAASVIAALKGLLSVVGKDATLGQILSALAPLATESTLSSLASAVAKETTLAQVLSALGALATETTLGGVKTAVDVLAGTVDTQAGAQKVTLSGSILSFFPAQPAVITATLSPLAAGETRQLADVRAACVIEAITLIVPLNEARIRWSLDRYTAGQSTTIPYWQFVDNWAAPPVSGITMRQIKYAGGLFGFRVGTNSSNEADIAQSVTPIYCPYGFLLRAVNTVTDSATWGRAVVAYRVVS